MISKSILVLDKLKIDWVKKFVNLLDKVFLETLWDVCAVCEKFTVFLCDNCLDRSMLLSVLF